MDTIGADITGTGTIGTAIGTIIIILLSSSATSAFQDGGAGAGEIHIGAIHMDIMDMGIRMAMEAMDTVITDTETATVMAMAVAVANMAAANTAPLLGRK